MVGEEYWNPQGIRPGDYVEYRDPKNLLTRRSGLVLAATVIGPAKVAMDNIAPGEPEEMYLNKSYLHRIETWF